VFDVVRSTMRLLDKGTQRRVYLSVACSFGLAILDVAAIGLVLPFVQAVMDRSAVRTGVFKQLAQWTGIHDGGRLLLALGMVIVVLFVARAFLAALFSWWQSGFLYQSEGVLAAQLFRGYLHQPYVSQINRNSAELIRNIASSTVTLYASVLQSLLNLVTESALVLLVVVLVVIVQPAVAGMTVVFFSLVGVGYYFAISRRAVAIGEAAQVSSRVTYQQLQQGFAVQKELRVLGREDDVAEEFARTRMEWTVVRRQQAFLQQLPRHYLETMLVLSVLLLSALLAHEDSQRSSLAVVGLFAAAAFRVMPSVNKILVAAHSMNMGADAVRTIEADVAARSAWLSIEDRSSTARTSIDRVLEVSAVTFRYPGATRPALDEVSIRLPRGQTIGVVGSSGAGKSTLIDLVLGLLEPEDGQVLVDGVDVRGDIRAWRRAIGYVPQQINLIDDTVRRNVALGQPDEEIDDAMVAEALQLAQLGRLADDLESSVGERGVRLSGGERQRVGIARALYRQPDLLVLDEATSSLDNRTERDFVEVLEGLRTQHSMLVVAHRLTTVRSCDRLYLLHDGKNAGSGTFAELAATNARFAEIARLDHSSEHVR
jgi:ABC-type multidrug transport system fused ATPase/permease subunit